MRCSEREERERERETERERQKREREKREKGERERKKSEREREDRQTDRQTDRYTARKTDRQTDGRTDISNVHICNLERVSLRQKGSHRQKGRATWSESHCSAVRDTRSRMASAYLGPYSMCPCAQLFPAPYCGGRRVVAAQ